MSRLGWAAALLAQFIGCYYLAAQLARARPRWNPALGLDHALPCVPQLAWLYLAGLALPFLPALLLPVAYLPRAAASFGMLIALAGLVFMVMPTDGSELRATCGQPAGVLGLVFELDPATNLFPSLHVGFAVLAAACLWQAEARGAVLTRALAVAQMLTVCLVKQHALLDVAAGAGLALLVYALCFAGMGSVSIQR